MAAVKLSGKSILALLLMYVVLIFVLQMWVGPRDRWAGYSVLTPLVAAALLPFRRTLLVGAFTLLAITGSYGFGVTGLSVGARFVVIMATALSFGISLIVCRVRLEREERVKRLMVARDRLSLLSAASSRVGGTLDVTSTARELAEVAALRFADSVTVDLFEPVLRGEDPQDLPADGCVTLRRAAHVTAVAATGRETTALRANSAGAGQNREVHVPARWLDPGRPAATRVLEGGEIGASGLPMPLPSAGTGAEGWVTAIAVPLTAGKATLGLAVFARGPGRAPFDADDLMLAEGDRHAGRRVRGQRAALHPGARNLPHPAAEPAAGPAPGAAGGGRRHAVHPGRQPGGCGR
ncbi:hypothetical protein [Actinacidiphila glaucinigra]|uniref:hypothetical protein n=1 Tax=Actinacidiphila glaucinigra TaxID=235986 RepID=UPI003D9016A6